MYSPALAPVECLGNVLVVDESFRDLTCCKNIHTLCRRAMLSAEGQGVERRLAFKERLFFSFFEIMALYLLGLKWY